MEYSSTKKEQLPKIGFDASFSDSDDSYYSEYDDREDHQDNNEDSENRIRSIHSNNHKVHFQYLKISSSSNCQSLSNLLNNLSNGFSSIIAGGIAFGCFIACRYCHHSIKRSSHHSPQYTSTVLHGSEDDNDIENGVIADDIIVAVNENTDADVGKQVHIV